MLTSSIFLFFLGGFLLFAFIGWKWGVVEKATEIALEEAFK